MLHSCQQIDQKHQAGPYGSDRRSGQCRVGHHDQRRQCTGRLLRQPQIQQQFQNTHTQKHDVQPGDHQQMQTSAHLEIPAAVLCQQRAVSHHHGGQDAGRVFCHVPGIGSRQPFPQTEKGSGQTVPSFPACGFFCPDTVVDALGSIVACLVKLSGVRSRLQRTHVAPGCQLITWQCGTSVILC